MANPFLMDEELVGVDDAVINPFLNQADGGDLGDADNPFASELSNPFAFTNDADEMPETQPDRFDAAMSFFGTTIEAEDDNLSVKSTAEEEDEELKKLPPMRPLSLHTQELINTVSNHLDETSCELLGRIPATRTPSPVSIRDLHTPSPTLDGGVDDLLNINDQATEINNQGSNIIDLMEVDANLENPFGLPMNTVPSIDAKKQVSSPAKKQPSRPPPPARPAPPRPVPPAAVNTASHPARPPRPAPPAQVNNASEPEDLFDMFGTVAPSKPPPPKTKEDILSLFDKPTQPITKPDLLSDDIILQEQNEAKQESEEQENNIDDPIFNSVLTRPDDSTHNITSEPPAACQKNRSIEQNADEDVVNLEKPVIKHNMPTPDIEITTVEDLPRSDDEDEAEIVAQVPVLALDRESTPPCDEDDDVLVASINGRSVPKLDQSPPTESEIQADNSDINVNDDLKLDEDVENSQFDAMDVDYDVGLTNGASSANPFASPEEDQETYPPTETITNIFSAKDVLEENIFAVDAVEADDAEIAPTDEFDAFAAKFESVRKDNISISEDYQISRSTTPILDAWGDTAFGGPNLEMDTSDGFGNDDDDFYTMNAPLPKDASEFAEKVAESHIPQKLSPPLPPTRTPGVGQSENEADVVNPFEDTGLSQEPQKAISRTDSQETPQSPLFDEDVSQPLEEFPRLNYVGPGWEMQLRQPNKKKITGQRFWKKIFVRLVMQNDVPVIQLLNQANDKQAFQELPLLTSYSVSEIGAQQYDQFGKIFTMKLQYIFYKERPGVRPGQVTKAERITNKLTKFAQYAIAGDYEGVKEFGSDLKKLGLPVEHAPQSTQLFKIGSMNYEDMKQLSICIEEALFRLPALRDRSLTYKNEEVQITAVDEIVVDQDAEGKILKQIARVRLFFLAFLSGMPTIELGVNDMWRQGKEVVGRHDIIPVATEEWIRLEAVEFHSVVNQEEYERTRTIKFQPPDANYIELLRFRIRPPKNRELPLQLKATWIVIGNKVELRADILVPGFTSRKLGQIPCEDVSVRFPIPECWIYLFRVEKHFRYGSVKSAHRRTGKIKGIERILGAVDTLQESLIEVTSGQAKYEHHHRAIVWRCPRLPKEGQGAYTTHQLVCRMALTSYDQIPNELAPYAFVEFTMPATQVSHTTVRSVSIQDSDSDEPPEKYVRYLARHEYKVGIETTHGETTSAYLAATKPIREESAAATKSPASPMPPSDSDTDSN